MSARICQIGNACHSIIACRVSTAPQWARLHRVQCLKVWLQPAAIVVAISCAVMRAAIVINADVMSCMAALQELDAQEALDWIAAQPQLPDLVRFSLCDKVCVHACE